MSEPDPLDRLSRVANQPKPPAPEFRDRLLAELLGDLTADPTTQGAPSSEHTTVAHSADESTLEVIMLSPDRNESPRGSRIWMMVAAAIAALALIGGLIVAGTRSDEDPVPADEPEPTAPAIEPEPEVESAQEPLPFPGEDVEPGRYETDLLGMSLTFDVPETATLWTARPNRVLLANSSDLRSPPYPVTSRSLSFSRISGWNTREEAVDPEYFGPGSIDPNDIDGWAAVNDVVASIPPCCRAVTGSDQAAERVSVSVADRDTSTLDVRLEPAETNQTTHCSDGESCAWAAAQSERGTTSRFDNGPLLSTGQVNRFWLLAIDGQDPLLIHAAAAADDEAWLELVENTTIATLELGPDAPPMSDADADPVPANQPEPATTEPETEEPAVTASSDDGGASVSVVLTDPFGPAGTPDQFAVEPDPISVEAGSVEIVAKNQGGDVHNLLIVKGDDPAALPVNEDGAVIEDDLPEDDFIGKIAVVDAGTEESASFDLDAGSYILFCNIVTILSPPESHFALGMVSTFTVI